MIALQTLGRAVHSAGSAVERDLASDLVLVTCRRHRDAEIPWAELSRAVGVSDTTLRRWRQRDRISKPSTRTAMTPLASAEPGSGRVPWTGPVPERGLDEDARSIRAAIQRSTGRVLTEPSQASSRTAAAIPGALSSAQSQAEPATGAPRRPGAHRRPRHGANILDVQFVPDPT